MLASSYVLALIPHCRRFLSLPEYRPVDSLSLVVSMMVRIAVNATLGEIEMAESEYDVLEGAPDYAEGVAALARWSTNYDHPNPYQLFCDLIGFNGEEFNEVFFCPPIGGSDKDGTHVPEWGEYRTVRVAMANLIDSRLGYMELGMLADALKEYAERPGDVTDYVRRIMEAGREDES